MKRTEDKTQATAGEMDAEGVLMAAAEDFDLARRLDAVIEEVEAAKIYADPAWGFAKTIKQMKRLVAEIRDRGSALIGDVVRER